MHYCSNNEIKNLVPMAATRKEVKESVLFSLRNKYTFGTGITR